jgi:Flp pilus assembly protein TadD
MKKKPKSHTPPPLSPWVGRIVLATVLLVVVLIYASVVTFQFLPFWDDDTNIHRNPLYAPLSWGSVAQFWLGPFQQLYIPVTYTVWAGLVALSRIIAGTAISFGPINAALFHGANVVAHLLAVAMVYLILRRILTAYAPKTALERPISVILASAAGALTFGIHPVQVETVAWVSGLRDLLGGALALASLEVFLSWLDRPAPFARGNWARYGGATLLLLLAFGSKPATVVTPVLALVLGFWLLRVEKRGWKRLIWLGPWFLAAMAEVVMTSHSQPAAELARSLVPIWARPLVAGDAMAFYLGKLAWPAPPWGLCADYGRAPNLLFEQGVLYWSWLIPAAVVLLLSLVVRFRIYLVPLLLLAIGVLPTLGIIPFNFQVVSTVSDRYLYLAMIGPAVAVALFSVKGVSKVRTGILWSILAGWGVLSLLQLPDWKRGETFFPATLARNPTSWKSRHNYACTLDAGGKMDEALREFAEAIRLRPSNAEAYNDMALTFLKTGRRSEAVQAFQQSLQIRPTAGAARNLAAALLMNGDSAQAAKVYRIAMQIDPSDLQNQRSLAWLLATHPDASIRNGSEAIDLSRKIVSATNGQVPTFLLTLAAAQAETGNFDEAIATAIQAAQVYAATGDPSMAATVEQRVIPALRAHQALRDDPVRN